jgi:hypothetical protein
METVPINLLVQDYAVGPLLIAFRNDPGIVKITVDVPPRAPHPAIPQKYGVRPNASKRKMVGDAARMLPSPTKIEARVNKQDIKRERAGRASPGIGRKLLLQALAAGTNARADLIKYLGESGISAKSAQSMLERAKSDKVVTSNGRGVYALTPKGKRKIADPAHSRATRKHEEV